MTALPHHPLLLTPEIHIIVGSLRPSFFLPRLTSPQHRKIPTKGRRYTNLMRLEREIDKY